MSRPQLCRLSDFRPAPESMLFSNGQHRYLRALREWFGDPLVVAVHRSKSCDFPLVRLDNGVSVGYNLYDYIVFIPKTIFARLDEKLQAGLSPADWHPSYTDWKPFNNEVLVYGPTIIEPLLRAGCFAS